MRRLEIDYVSDIFGSYNYKLTTTVYHNSTQKLCYVCPKGHKHSIRWNNWQQGQRCPYCSGVGKPVIEFIRASFESEGYNLLTTEYINAHSCLDYVCKNGHPHRIRWNDWQQGYRCTFCYNERLSGKDNPFYGRHHTHKTKIKMSTNHADVSGDNNPMWKGGISCEPYCDAWADKEYKEDIKRRDNYECQNLNCWKTNNNLTVHHIDYVKKHCEPWNLITLCRSCNSRANKNREHYIEYYRDMMNKKHGYIYE